MYAGRAQGLISLIRQAFCAYCDNWKLAVINSRSRSSSLSRRACIVFALMSARVASPSLCIAVVMSQVFFAASYLTASMLRFVSPICYRRSSLSSTSMRFRTVQTISSSIVTMEFGTRVEIIGFRPHSLVVEPSRVLLSDFPSLGC